MEPERPLGLEFCPASAALARLTPSSPGPKALGVMGAVRCQSLSDATHRRAQRAPRKANQDEAHVPAGVAARHVLAISHVFETHCCDSSGIGVFPGICKL